MISIPCDLGSANTVEDVFGGYFDVIDYRWTWVMYTRDETLNRYVRLDLASSLELGESYWIFSQEGGLWHAGNGTLTSFSTSADCPSPRGCYTIDLVSPSSASSYRYSMVGNPGNVRTDWASVQFLIDSLPYFPPDADANDFVAKIGRAHV